MSSHPYSRSCSCYYCSYKSQKDDDDRNEEERYRQKRYENGDPNWNRERP